MKAVLSIEGKIKITAGRIEQGEAKLIIELLQINGKRNQMVRRIVREGDTITIRQIGIVLNLTKLRGGDEL
jgi:hypothetical protein